MVESIVVAVASAMIEHRCIGIVVVIATGSTMTMIV
jgi:hypothetical protein